jgi:plastocyanin
LAVVSAHAANQTVTATPSDTFSPAAVTINQGETVTWHNGGGSHNVKFDDGSFEDPTSPSTNSWTVSHPFDTPGTFRYVCEQHEDDGMVGTVTVLASQTGTTPPPPPPPGGGGPQPPGTPGAPGKDTTAPVISRFGMTDSRFRVRRGASAFVFRVSEPVDVRIKISRVLKRRGRTRYVVKGTLVRSELRRTSQKVPFSGRLSRRALHAGLYRGTISATDLSGNRSLLKRTSFRIVSG